MTSAGHTDPLPGFESWARMPPWLTPLPISIVRSARRKRTVSAELVNGTMVVTAPKWMSASDVDDTARSLLERFERMRRSTTVDLPGRAGALARRYRLPAAESIRWSAGMARQWGSCTVRERSIRISDTVAAFPPWVLDYVIVHELAHLEIADHSSAFWDLVARFPKAERARGYLIAKSGE